MSVRRINPIASETEDILRVVRRLEEAIAALHRMADTLPAQLAEGSARDDEAEPHLVTEAADRGRNRNDDRPRDGEDDAAATGDSNRVDPRSGNGGLPPSA